MHLHLLIARSFDTFYYTDWILHSIWHCNASIFTHRTLFLLILLHRLYSNLIFLSSCYMHSHFDVVKNLYLLIARFFYSFYYTDCILISSSCHCATCTHILTEASPRTVSEVAINIIPDPTTRAPCIVPSMLQCVAVVWCVAECCSLLQCVAGRGQDDSRAYY